MTRFSSNGPRGPQALYFYFEIILNKTNHRHVGEVELESPAFQKIPVREAKNK